MVISVYIAHKFLSGLRNVGRVEKLLGMICKQAILALRKLKRIWRKSLKLFEETIAWAFEQFLNSATSTRKLLDFTSHVEEWFMVSSSEQHACQEIFGKTQYCSVGTSTIFTRPSIVWHFSLPKSQVCTKMNPIRVCECSESQSDTTLEQHITKWPTVLLPTMEDPHGAM